MRYEMKFTINIYKLKKNKMTRIKIKKNVLGEEYYFYITVMPKTFDCTYSIHFRDSEQFKAIVSNNFEHIILDKHIELEGYENGLNPPKKIISKIKIPKDQKYKFKEEINGSFY